MNQFSPPGSLHLHWARPSSERAHLLIQWCGKSFIICKTNYLSSAWSAPNLATSWSSFCFFFFSSRKVTTVCRALLTIFLLMLKKTKRNCVRARVFEPFQIMKGYLKVASWIGLEILVPKHPWKSKIGPLQPILAAKRYVSFFLGHPVHFRYVWPGFHINRSICYFLWSWSPRSPAAF